MSTSNQIKLLHEGHNVNNNERFYATASQWTAEGAQWEHRKLVEELRQIVWGALKRFDESSPGRPLVNLSMPSGVAADVFEPHADREAAVKDVLIPDLPKMHNEALISTLTKRAQLTAKLPSSNHGK